MPNAMRWGEQSRETAQPMCSGLSNAPIKSSVLSRRSLVMLCVVIGIGLEFGVHALSGRREAWDSPQYWTIGLPLAIIASAALGFVSRRRDWLFTFLIVPSQVLTMMARSGEIGSLWPLAIALSSILSTPFVAAAFVGSRFRPKRDFDREVRRQQ